MSLTIPVLVVSCLVGLQDRKPGGFDTPEAAFKAFQAAWQAQDWDSLYLCYPPSERAKEEDDWREERKKLAIPENREMLEEMAKAWNSTPAELLKMSHKDSFTARMKAAAQRSKGKSDFGEAVIIKKEIQGTRALLFLKADSEETIAMASEEKRWYMSWRPSPKAEVASNERNAAAAVRMVYLTQLVIQSEDSDKDGAKNFWVADIRGLNTLFPAGDFNAIDRAVACADASPSALSRPLAEEKTPKAGYMFAVIPKYKENGGGIAYDNRTGRNAKKFGVCAYPAKYGSTGTLTFILNETGTLHSKDNGGKPVQEFPEKPEAEGWKRHP